MEVFDAFAVPEEERERLIKLEFGWRCTIGGIVPFGGGQRACGALETRVHRLLGEREIDRHYTDAELDEDLRYA